MPIRLFNRILFGPSQRRKLRCRRVRGAFECLESRELLSAVTIQLAATADTTIYQADPDASNGAGEFIVAGGGTRGLVKFDVSGASIPDGSTIIDAVLTLNVAHASEGNAAVSVHRLTTSWGERGSNASEDETVGASAQTFDATWLYASYDGELWNSPGGDFSGGGLSTSVTGVGSFDWVGDSLIDDVQAWLDDSSLNHGWLLVGGSGATAFLSKDGPDSGLAPTLEITYEEPPEPPAIVDGRLWNDLNGDGLQSDPLLSELRLGIANGNTYFDDLGGEEYWFRSQVSGKWYFLTSNGTLTRWSGIGGSLTGTVVGVVDTKYYLEPSLVESSHGDPEPWLNGWTVELLNGEGIVIETSVTHSRDINGDGAYDNVTEGGWYYFEVDTDVAASYSVRQVVPEGWRENVRVEFEETDSSSQAVNSLDLQFYNSWFENVGGLGEKWLRSEQSGWYYITPNGNLYRWNGVRISDESPLTGQLIASPGTTFFDTPELFWTGDGFNAGGTEANNDARVDFGNMQALVVKGRIWLDFVPDGQRDENLTGGTFVPDRDLTAEEGWLFDHDHSAWYFVDADGNASFWSYDTGDSSLDDGELPPEYPASGNGTVLTAEPWLNGRTVELIDENGEVVASTVTASIDLNEDGSIDVETERGWYYFEGIAPGNYKLRSVAEGEWTQTAPGNYDAEIAAQLNEQYGFRRTANDFFNWGGELERWIIDQNNNWYYILPDGSLYRWTPGSSAATGGLLGTFINQFSSQVYVDLKLLTDPDPSVIPISIGEGVSSLELWFGHQKELNEIL